MTDAFVTVSTTSKKQEVFDVIIGIFHDSFARSIMFANYMAPRIVDGSEVVKGARIEALVQNGRKDIWAQGRIDGISKDDFGIKFSFDTTAFHNGGPTAEKNRRAEFIFLCKDGRAGNCDLEIGVVLAKKVFGGVPPQHLILEIVKFLKSQDIEVSDLPSYF